MGKTFQNLTWDDLCDLMCGGPEEDEDIIRDAVSRDDTESDGDKSFDDSKKRRRRPDDN